MSTAESGNNEHEHQNWNTVQWKKVAQSDESYFLLHHVDGQMHVHRLPGEHMAPGCTMGRRQAGRGGVMIWAMFFWENLGPAIHVDVTLTRTIYLSIVADHVHPFIETVFLDGCDLFQQDTQLAGMFPTTLANIPYKFLLCFFFFCSENILRMFFISNIVPIMLNFEKGRML